MADPGWVADRRGARWWCDRHTIRRIAQIAANTSSKGTTMRIGDIAAELGKGLVAGAAGTALMTLASTVEMKLQGRDASSAPADAAAKVLGVEPKGDAEKARFSTMVHWAYGTSWGATRGLLGAVGLVGPAAAGVHFAAVWGSGLVMLPALEVAPELREWGSKAIALDALHHVVYVLGASLAFSALERRSATS